MVDATRGVPINGGVPLDPVQRDVVCTIFQDCIDQLGILGGIIPNYSAKPSSLDNVSYSKQFRLEVVIGMVKYTEQYDVQDVLNMS